MLDISKLKHQFDLFGFIPYLEFNKKLKFVTNFGMIMSFIYFSLIILSVVYFSKDLYYRDNPETNYSEIFQSKPDDFVLDNTKFGLMFGFEVYFKYLLSEKQDFNGQLYKRDDIIVPTIQQWHFYRVITETGETVQMYESQIYEFENCTAEHFANFEQQPELKIFYENLQLSKGYCIPSSLSNLTIGGAYEADDFKMVRISVDVCNKTKYPDKNCAEDDVINEYLSEGYGAAFFNTLQIEPRNYDDYNQYSGQSIFTSTSKKQKKGFEQIIIFNIQQVLILTLEDFTLKLIKVMFLKMFKKVLNLHMILSENSLCLMKTSTSFTLILK